MKEIIEYICLAKSIPEIDKRDDKLYTCSLGYSPQKGLIRLYPLPISGIKKWHRYKLEVERNKRDTRKASWKISSTSRFEDFQGFSDDVIDLGPVSIQTKKHIEQVLIHNISPSISELNKNRDSIGLVRVSSINPKWEANDRFVNENQPSLFEDVEVSVNDFQIYTKDTKEKISRLLFKDGDGFHNLQLNEWQYFEYGRKFGFNNDAFRYINTKGDKLLLLGNMLQYQNNWMVLSVFDAPKMIMMNMFGVAI